jgi:outer membrane protein OmpA-like peptidoglycan-associated protein
MRRSTILLFVLVLFASPGLWAQADQTLFDYKVNAKAQTDQGAPVLILRAREFIKSGKVEMKRADGKDTHVQRIGKMKPGQEKRIAFRQPKGQFKWKVTVSGETQFNQTLKMAFETETAWVDPIRLQVDPQEVKVGQGKLILHTNVPLDKVDIEVMDKSGSKYVNTTQSIGGKSGAVPITWSPAKADVGAIRLKAYDVAGFWNAVILEPFWVEIPHREVIFNFGKATWEDKETPKLKETLKGVREAMAKHKRKGLQMQLYIVGYTDTVGGKADNMRLSTARARAIAKWFRKSGLKIPIHYQGFGESVLAVSTPDNTPEERNRRALYILGNAPPPKSGQIPRGNWKSL